MSSRKIIVCLMMTVVPSLVYAADEEVSVDYTTQAETSRPVTRSEAPEPPSRKDKGSRAAGFLWSARVVGTVYGDDNIYATESDQVKDTVYLLSPSFKIKSDWEKHSLTFKGGADLGRYSEYDGENYDDYWLNGNGSYRVNRKTAVFGVAGFRQSHEDRGSQDASFGAEPTIYDETTANVGVIRGEGRYSFILGGAYSVLDFNDVPTGVAFIDNDDRDRSTPSATFRAGYLFAKDVDGFIRLKYEQRDYLLTYDSDGYQRSSDGYRAAVGVKVDKIGRLVGEAAVGYIGQNYVDERFGNVSEPGFNVDLKWKAATNSLLSFRLKRSIEETNLSGSSGFLYDRYGIRLDQRINAKLYMDVALTLRNARYYEVDRNDDYYEATAGLAYVWVKGLSLSFDYLYTTRDTNIPGFDYRRQRVIASIAGSF